MNAYHGRHADVTIRIDAARTQLRRRHQCDFEEVLRHLDHLEATVTELLAIAQRGDHTPTHLAITLTAHEGTIPMTDYTPGQDIHAAAAATNAEGATVPDQLTWSTTAGTLTVDDPSTLTATITGAPLGGGTVSVTDGFGLTASADFNVVDPTPAALSLTLS